MFDFNLYYTLQCLTWTCIVFFNVWFELVLLSPMFDFNLYYTLQYLTLSCIVPSKVFCWSQFLFAFNLYFFSTFCFLLILYSFNISMISLTTIDTDDNQYIVMDRAYGPFQHCLFYLLKLLEFKAWINLSSGQIFKLLLLIIDNVPIF